MAMNTTNGDDEVGETTSQSADGTWANHSFSVLAALAAGALVTGTVAYRLLEDWGWIDSFYFSVITLTTVGYGDLSPSTPASKLFTIVYVITGISLIGAYLNEVMKRRARRAAGRRSET
jgi:cation transport ATPase